MGPACAGKTAAWRGDAALAMSQMVSEPVPASGSQPAPAGMNGKLPGARRLGAGARVWRGAGGEPRFAGITQLDQRDGVAG